MPTKGYEHHEYKEFSSQTNGPGPVHDAEFERFRSEVMPKTKLGLMEGRTMIDGRTVMDSRTVMDGRSMIDGRNLMDGRKGHGEVERYYEYKEETHPSGHYDRKDLHSVEQYTIPPKNVETSYYTYEQQQQQQQREIQNLRNTTTSYTNNVTPVPGYQRSLEMSKELSHSVKELDTLLDDLQRDRDRHATYKSGYMSDNTERSYDYRKETSTPILRTAPSSGYSTLKSAEMMETYNSTSRVERPPPPPPVTTREKEIHREFVREEHHESRAIPSQISPAIPKYVPPVQSYPPSTPTPMNKVTTTVKTYTYEVPADQQVPIPTVHTTEKAAYLAENHTTSTRSVPGSPLPSRPYCDDCNTRTSTKEYIAEQHVERRTPVPTRYQQTTMNDTSKQISNERIVYPPPPVPNGAAPGTYKWSETTYSAFDETLVSGGQPPRLQPSPAPPAIQQPPKKLEELMADFPDSKFPVEDHLRERKVEIVHEKPATKNVSGPPVYYPPEQKVKASAAYDMKAGGGKWAKGEYQYEASAKEKSKNKSGKTEYGYCVPLCCAMPCSIM